MACCAASLSPSPSRPLALAAAACGHGESFDGGILHKGDLSVRVGPCPSQWTRVRIEGADLAYRDEAREGSTMFDVRCGRSSDAPLTVLTEHLIMGTTERDFVTQETLPFDGREALHTLMRAKLDGVPMQYDIYVMKKDGCVYDLVYVAPPARFTAGARRLRALRHRPACHVAARRRRRRRPRRRERPMTVADDNPLDSPGPQRARIARSPARAAAVDRRGVARPQRALRRAHGRHRDPDDGAPSAPS